MTGTKAQGRDNVQGVRTDLEDDFRKALSIIPEVSQEIPKEVKHEKLAKLHYWRSALNSNLDIVLTV